MIARPVIRCFQDVDHIQVLLIIIVVRLVDQKLRFELISQVFIVENVEGGNQVEHRFTLTGYQELYS